MATLDLYVKTDLEAKGYNVYSRKSTILYDLIAEKDGVTYYVDAVGRYEPKSLIEKLFQKFNPHINDFIRYLERHNGIGLIAHTNKKFQGGLLYTQIK
jgi:hypothetical protein